MSKSPNILWPALGVTGIALGLAFGLSTRSYKAEEAAVAQRQTVAAQEQVAQKTASLSDLEARIAQIQQEAEARVAQLALSSPSDGSVGAPAPERDAAFGLGRVALPEEVAAWDVDILPDGRGLPEGRGDVYTGEEVFADACAACHGDFAEGVDNWPPLAGGFDTLGDKDPVKTVGSYWPYLSTVWDYVHRSMPFGSAQTLSDDEVYAIVAYILYSNDLVDEDFELSHENFKDVAMHNSGGFIEDDRPEREYAAWRAQPCMKTCKDSVTITMRATFLDVTPEDGSESVMNHATASDGPTFSASDNAASDAANTENTETGSLKQDDARATLQVAALDPALVGAGEKVFKKCKSCHMVGTGAKNRSGPQLNGVLGRTFGSVDGFKYSDVFKTAAENGRVWTDAELAAFLAKPKAHMKGTRMSFAGLRKDSEVQAVIAYLKSFGG